ncbi:replication factor C subunit 2 [Halteromyces radiatus]|uniref:replication factor C subunit 2 n=1 Tax=Halteromyces radiatus TaxID=101107 RepID=UPI00221FD94B|nr:replication factor C subunit 2 [Halteromyces radiatus]KAI8100012.1 replication factor C subunit 2 [Halteromyces radiatus]
MNFFQNYSTASAQNKSETKSHIKPWVEKYRPKTIDDISSQEQAVAVLKKALQSNNLPHLLFYGPPGTGKTSTILALAQELYGPKFAKSRTLELNASDERGINIVREKIKNFSRSTLTASDTDSKYPNPPYKIIILDEADSMTKDAQSALRRTMEAYSKTTRFCIICNYVSRIIEPITSRCAKFRFKPLPVADLTSRLEMICNKENVTLANGTMNALIKASNGDLRKAITFLQSGANLHKTESVTVGTINEMAGLIPDDTMQNIIKKLESGNTNDIEELAQDLMNAGYSGELLVYQLHDVISRNEFLNLTSLQQSKISQILGTADFHLIRGADEHIQILNVLLQLGLIISE